MSSTAGLTDLVLKTVADAQDELVDLTSSLIAFDTTARNPGDPPRQERELQEYLAGRLSSAGASIDLWEPDPAAIGGRQVPAGLDFDQRPQLAARFAGDGGGRSLLLNGHIDVVSAEPSDLWTSDPFSATLRDGMLYGRGAADMKGGVACMVFAAELLDRLKVRLRGDLIVNTNTDEESSGSGSLACVAHGLRADGGICPEATRGMLWRACRGSISLKVTVLGRAGHVEARHPHWREGGAVNAIDKAELVLAAVHEFQRRWATDPNQRHAFLAPPTVTTTVIRGGDWYVTVPARCELMINVSYLPVDVDADGYGSTVAAAIEAMILKHCNQDDWLREHPPSFAWGPDLPPFELAAGDPIIDTVAGAARRVGYAPQLGHTDSWFDAGSFVRAGNCPMVGFGPVGHSTHGIDEHIAVDELVRCAGALALAAIEWCGVA